MPTIKLQRKKKRDKTVNKQLYQDVYNTPRWLALRQSKLRDNPLCEACESEGRTKVADAVHHIIPFDVTTDKYELDRLAYDYDNLMSICNECHAKIHQHLRSH